MGRGLAAESDVVARRQSGRGPIGYAAAFRAAGIGHRVSNNPQRLIDAHVADDHIVLTLHPTYASDAGWKNEAERPAYTQANKLRFVRPNQLKAVQARIYDVRFHAEVYGFQGAPSHHLRRSTASPPAISEECRQRSGSEVGRLNWAQELA
jgi:hypothetical protein